MPDKQIIIIDDGGESVGVIRQLIEGLKKYKIEIVEESVFVRLSVFTSKPHLLIAETRLLADVRRLLAPNGVSPESICPVILISNPEKSDDEVMLPDFVFGVISASSNRESVDPIIDAAVRCCERIQKIYQRNSMYRACFEFSNEAILIHSKDDGAIIAANRKACDLYGFTEEEIPSIKIEMYSEGVSPYGRTEALEWINRSINGGPQLFVWHARDKSGRLFWVEVNMRAADVGGTQRIIVSIRDITTRTLAEEALRKSEHKFREIAELLPLAVYESGGDGQLKYANKKAFEYFGYSMDEFRAGINIMDIIIESERERARENLGKLIRGEIKEPSEYVMARKSGETFSGLVYQIPIFQDNEFAGIRGALLDISERIETERKISESEQKYRELADLLPQMVFEADVNGRIIYINQKAGIHFGYSSQDVDEGINITQVVTGDHKERMGHLFADVMRGEKMEPAEFELIGRDLIRFDAMIYAAPIYRDNNCIGVRGVVIDITERKKAEATMKAAIVEKDILLKEVHHRVKNNLQVITSILSLQADRIRNKEMLEQFKTVQRRIRSIALVHERLYQSQDLSRISMATYVMTILREIQYHFAGLTEHIVVGIDVEDIYLGVDKVIPCGLILNEIVTNVYKYAFPASHQTERRLDISFRVDDNKALLSVSDNGAGLPESVDIAGTKSLGLQLVQMLVQQLKGTIAVTRQNGTAITVVFKIYSGE
jgi:PAS domain S-box-containing protein